MSSASSSSSAPPSWWRRFLKFFGLLKHDARLVVIGLDNSGKSTLINHLRPQRQAAFEVVPTVGFAVEKFELEKLQLTVVDMSGASTYRSLWETYYAGCSAIVFVVDAADRIRMAVAKDELDVMLAHADVRGGSAPLLVFANKSDLPGALEAADVSLMLGLPALQGRAWQIQASNALSGDGVALGLAWLVEQMERRADDADEAAKKR
jgi:ADP-ribosylation factor-like protein 6